MGILACTLAQAGPRYQAPIAQVLKSGPQRNPIEHDFYVIISLYDIGLSSLTQFSREQSSIWGMDKAPLLTSAANSV